MSVLALICRGRSGKSNNAEHFQYDTVSICMCMCEPSVMASTHALFFIYPHNAPCCACSSDVQTKLVQLSLAFITQREQLGPDTRYSL
jgi:hypothetical protein